MYKKTGFHFDVRLEKDTNKIKYLSKNENLSFKSDIDSPNKNIKNQLIIGDNYDALKNLLINYRNQIDVIYIDPPYGKDDMGKFAETNYNNAITRDNLLSMLYPRLQMAKQLLSEDGVIFCSIDDKNQAYVKCLFDDVFGEENFVANQIWKNKSGGGNDSSHIAVDHEYIHVYSKNKNNCKFNLDKNATVTTNYNLTDENGKKYGLDRLDKQSLGYQESLDFIIFGPDGKEYKVEHKDPNNKMARWRWSKDTVKERYSELVFKYPYIYTKNYEKTEGQKPRSLLIEERFGRTRTGSTLLADVLGTKSFAYPKSIQLLKYLISISTNNSSIVLDFFAGSGTTGQAVLELNKEDGGSRQFILVTNNEVTDVNPNGIAYDVTCERLKRVMTGECYDGSNDFKWIQDNEALGGDLEVVDISECDDVVDFNEMSPFELIDETLYGLDKFENIADKIKWVCENFKFTMKSLDEEHSSNSKENE